MQSSDIAVGFRGVFRVCSAITRVLSGCSANPLSCSCGGFMLAWLMHRWYCMSCGMCAIAVAHSPELMKSRRDLCEALDRGPLLASHRYRSRRPARSCSSVEVLSEISPLALLQLLWRASAFLLVACLQAILSSESGPLSPAVSVFVLKLLGSHESAMQRHRPVVWSDCSLGALKAHLSFVRHWQLCRAASRLICLVCLARLLPSSSLSRTLMFVVFEILV